MTIIDGFNLGMSIAGIVLSVCAIGLSFWFYDKAKDAEQRTLAALEGIKSQTETLKDITAKQMGKLIRSATEVRPMDEIITLIATFRDFPSPQIQLKDAQISSLTAQSIEGYIGAFFYASFSNLLGQINLPKIEDYDEKNPVHLTIKGVVDKSSVDVANVGRILSQVDPKLIQASSVVGYYNDALQWVESVKDSTAVFVEKSKS